MRTKKEHGESGGRIAEGLPDVRAIFMTIMSTESRFWGKVKKADGCWEWQAGMDGFGYGKFSVKRASVRAHRVSMMLHLRRFLTPSECVLHKCDNPLCVNPAHLYIGDRRMNGLDMRNRSRAPGQRGALNGNAVLTEIVVRAIRREYVPRIMTRAMLSEKYGVSIHTVENIIYDKDCWRGIV